VRSDSLADETRAVAGALCQWMMMEKIHPAMMTVRRQYSK
jgi:hypothetical protein